jgi:hypothetical protein
MAQAARRILIVLAIAVLCASCRVDVNVNVAMQRDGSGAVTITAVADPAIVKQAPDLATDLRFTDLREAGWNVSGPVTEPNGGLRVVLTQAFSTPEQANQILANINGPNGPLSGITVTRKRSGARTTFRLDGHLQVTGGLAAYSDANLLAAVGATPFANELANAKTPPADALGITFTAALPAKARSTTGTEQTGVLSWTVPADGSAIDVATVAEHRDPTNRWAGPVSTGAMIALLAWLGVSLFFIGYVLVAHYRRAPRERTN